MAKKAAAVKSARITGDTDKEPTVWMTQLQNNVNYGVRDHSRVLSKAAVRRAIEHFTAIKFFVEVELPEITAKNEQEKLRRSAAFAQSAKKDESKE